MYLELSSHHVVPIFKFQINVVFQVCLIILSYVADETDDKCAYGTSGILL
jgi:hypothetical protein